jgi:hypothetical protein
VSAYSAGNSSADIRMVHFCLRISPADIGDIQFCRRNSLVFQFGRRISAVDIQEEGQQLLSKSFASIGETVLLISTLFPSAGKTHQLPRKFSAFAKNTQQLI